MEYSFKPTNWLTVLKEFALLIDTKVSDEERLELQGGIANGFVRAGSCNEEFHFILINGKMNLSFTFNGMRSTAPRSFMLIYIEVFAPLKLSITDLDNKVYGGL